MFFFRLPAGGRSLIWTVLLAGVLSLSSRAQTVTTLVSDNFDTLVNAGTGLRDANGKYSTGATASTWWYVQTGGSLATAATAVSATGNFSGSAIQANYSGTSRVGISPFASTTLAIGDSLTVSFDFRYVADPTDNNRSPQFGFFNGTNPGADSTSAIPALASGYNADMSEGATGGSFLKKGLFTPFANSSDVTFGSGVNLALSGTTPTRYTFVLTRTAVSTIVASLYLNGSTTAALTGTDTGATDFTFNEFILRGRDTAQIDNFVVTSTSAIPEPATTAVISALAVLAAVAVRRRRHGAA